MLVHLVPYPADSGASISLEVEPERTIKDLITLYRYRTDEPFRRKMIILNDEGKAIPNHRTLQELNIPEEHTLRIGYKDDIFPNVKPWKKILCAVGAAILILFVISAIATYLVHRKGGKSVKKKGNLENALLFRRSGHRWCENFGKNARKLGIVVHGGLSETCATSYSWNSERHRGTGCVSEENVSCAPGSLASDDPTNHMKRVMIRIRNVLNFIEPKKIPVYFATTSSMRIYNFTHPREMNDSLNQMKDYLTQAGLDIKEFGMISGEDEALYGWIASNFLTGRFLDFSGSERLCYMNLGESSTEISFEAARGERVRSLQLYGKTYHVFARSYLCFGREMARKRYQSFLITDFSNKTVEDPCLPRHYIERVYAADIIWGICSKNNRHFNAHTKQIDLGRKVYKFVGSGNPSFCRGNVSKLLDEAECKKSAFLECFEKIDVAENTEISAFSVFHSIAKMLNLRYSTLKDFSHIIQDICLNDKDGMRKYDGISSQSKLCFTAQYVYELLVTGYGLGETTWKRIRFIGGNQKEEITWTLGYIINATEDRPLK